MKALKKVLIGTAVLGTFTFFIQGSMNSIIVDKQAFLKNDLNIKFAKRLDEMNGEIIIGRMAASIPKWNSAKSLAVSETSSEEKVEIKQIKKAKFVKAVKQVAKVIVPEPTVKNARDLKLTGGLFNKKPLKDGKGYTGKAHVVDGVIEEIDVTLPGGKNFIINTNERMVGNVFQYEDTDTREMRSGLFYEVKKGHYMITLTDDSNYSGLRLEFKGESGSEVKTKKSGGSWAMNDQNPEDNPELDVNNFEDDSHEAYEVEDRKDEYAYQREREEEEKLDVYTYNDEVEEVETEEYETEEDEVDVQDNELVQATSFGFNFNS